MAARTARRRSRPGWAPGSCPIPARGYGAALIGGIRAARGRYVIMGDSDDSYDFSKLDDFVTALREGWQLVMGNRFRGGIAPGAMPPLHRYLGNPVLSAAGRVLYGSPAGDFHCGLRGFDRDAMLGLGLNLPGMEFASEMVVKATIQKLRITEVPTTLSKDGRSRPPHLRSWRDGWRHLRFLLLLSPRWVFLYTGAAMFAVGVLAMLLLDVGPVRLFGATFDIHSLLYASLLVVVGYQSVLFWIFCKTLNMSVGMLSPDPCFVRLHDELTLERSLLFALALLDPGPRLRRRRHAGLGPHRLRRAVARVHHAPRHPLGDADPARRLDRLDGLLPQLPAPGAADRVGCRAAGDRGRAPDPDLGGAAALARRAERLPAAVRG